MRVFKKNVPFLHSWRDSDYAKYGHNSAPSNTKRSFLVFVTGFCTGLAVTCTTSPFTNARTVIMTRPGEFSGMFSALGKLNILVLKSQNTDFRLRQKNIWYTWFLAWFRCSVGTIRALCNDSIPNLGTTTIHVQHQTHLISINCNTQLLDCQKCLLNQS